VTACWILEIFPHFQPVLGQQPSVPDNLAQASALLNISARALEDTQQEGLQPADMVSLIQLLSLTADVPSQAFAHVENGSRENIPELSHNFISVADSVISEDNALKWKAIKEVEHDVHINWAYSHCCCSLAEFRFQMCAVCVHLTWFLQYRQMHLSFINLYSIINGWVSSSSH